jgi:hypothetical protein
VHAIRNKRWVGNKTLHNGTALVRVILGLYTRKHGRFLLATNSDKDSHHEVGDSWGHASGDWVVCIECDFLAKSWSQGAMCIVVTQNRNWTCYTAVRYLRIASCVLHMFFWFHEQDIWVEQNVNESNAFILFKTFREDWSFPWLLKSLQTMVVIPLNDDALHYSSSGGMWMHRNAMN